MSLDFSTIPAPSHKCVVCDRDLAAVSKHPSVLELTAKGDPHRRDICQECWEKMADRQFFSFWLAQREAPKPDPKVAREEQNRRLTAVFEMMLDSKEDRFRPHLYVLAHTLMKRRLLKWVGSRKGEDGRERIVFRNAATDEEIEIEEIDLADQAMVAVVHEIERALSGEARERLAVPDSDGAGEGSLGSAGRG